MLILRGILAAAILAAGLVGPLPSVGAMRYACQASALTEGARRELQDLAGASAGQIRLTDLGHSLRVTLANPARWTQRLADWAARHNVRIPLQSASPTLSAAEAVVAGDSANRPLAPRAVTFDHLAVLTLDGLTLEPQRHFAIPADLRATPSWPAVGPQTNPRAPPAA